MNKLDNTSAFVPIITFILGFLVSRLTMSKKEKRDYEQKLFDNSKDLMIAQHDRFLEFSSTLRKYVSNQDNPTLEDFYEIAVNGEKYFYQLKIISDAILSNKVDMNSRDNTLVPKVKEAVEKVLPKFYDILTKIAQKNDFDYNGVLKRENYESLYKVSEKFR
jgi:hypothetical protein